MSRDEAIKSIRRLNHLDALSIPIIKAYRRHRISTLVENIFNINYKSLMKTKDAEGNIYSPHSITKAVN